MLRAGWSTITVSPAKLPTGFPLSLTLASGRPRNVRAFTTIFEGSSVCLVSLGDSRNSYDMRVRSRWASQH